MAIQLNDRDYRIFKLLDEHQVLLEKHIAWFVAPEAEDKPVLIRDRLRKLFYLDYLLCQRHESKLPWWTTPTKPLVYMLAPLACTISGTKQQNSKDFDINNNDWQRTHLEIANIRMIFLIAKKEGLLTTLEWETCSSTKDNLDPYDAIISCNWQSTYSKIGLISHPKASTDLAIYFSKETIRKDITHTTIICANQSDQESLQKSFAALASKTNVNSILLATHQDLYKSGLAKVSWQNVFGEKINFPSNTSPPGWRSDFGTMNAA